MIGSASAIAAVAIVSTVLGVKYLGKKDQEKPGEQENKDDGKGKKDQKNPDEKNKKDLGEKKKKSKEELKDFKSNLKVKVGEWLNDSNKRKQELSLSTKEKTGNLLSIFDIFKSNDEKDIGEEEVIDVLNVLYNALSDEKQLKSVEESSSDGVFLRLDDCHFLCKFKDDDHRYVLEFYKGDYKTTLWFRTDVT